MKAKIELTREQLDVVEHALELYFRFHMVQTLFLADELAWDNYNFELKLDPAGFDDRIEYREKLEVLFKQIEVESHKYNRTKTVVSEIAGDIWQVIRHELYLKNGGDPNNYMDVRADNPMSLSGLPLPVIEFIDEE